MENKITICIADDHPLFLAGVLSVLGRREDIEILGQASNGTEALSMIQSFNPDIALLDVQMPGMDGMQVAEACFKNNPEQKIIFLTMFSDENFARRAFSEGIKGYVLKENAVTQILIAIDTVMSGSIYISSQLNAVLSPRRPGKVTSEHVLFTQSEKRVLKLIAEGRSTKEIAQSAHLSEKTIENHRGNICKKLGITGTASLLRYATQNKSKFD